jgi:fibronectin-binding autotransporter adhesin
MAISSTLLNASGIRVGSGLAPAVYLSSTGAPTVTTSGSPSAGKQCYAFNGAGTIMFSTGGLIEVYMIGGGGCGISGGGGAGGLYYNTKIFVQPSVSYTVIVGAGGTFAYTPNFGSSGGASGIFAGTEPICFIGGGGAGGKVNGSGLDGPCTGGGGGSTSGQPGSLSTPSTGLAGLDSGFAGGLAYSAGAQYNGAGGGGIGGVGGNSTASLGGTGGIGLASSITGTSVSRGGGGGGGANGGTGGTASFGGAAGTNNATIPANATANTGGGGGGAYNATSGSTTIQKGGSGVVIILVG